MHVTTDTLEPNSLNHVTSPSPELVRAELARIVASADFTASERAARFLTYVVEETLGGRSERIKAFSVAIEVFGRDSTFDAQNDPAVRIEAGRLRRALKNYYLPVIRRTACRRRNDVTGLFLSRRHRLEEGA